METVILKTPRDDHPGFEPTYEGWKREAKTVAARLQAVLSLPMRDGNPRAAVTACCLSSVLSLPMRDGNS